MQVAVIHHARPWIPQRSHSPASALKVPVAYFYAETDAEAEMLLLFNALPIEAREEAVKNLRRRVKD